MRVVPFANRMSMIDADDRAIDGTGSPLAGATALSVQGDDPPSTLEGRIAFLSRAQSYPEGTARVECIETHMSWVFLTDRHAYKLKKPIRTAYFDLRDLAARSRNCSEEVRLNRRLSSGVYLGTVPLRVDPAGELVFAPEGNIVDWLVKMRRLPAGRMLDQLIRDGLLGRTEVESVVGHLCDFYRRSDPAITAAGEYRQAFADGIADCRRTLCQPSYALATERVERVCALQLDFLSRPALFDARERAGRIVEGHGDLRPEHICLEPPPQIIDCLEFSRRLRTLDTLDELGFLALECERMGAPQVARQILEAYRANSGDAAPDSLANFYQSYRASVRATLAILHLQEPGSPDIAKWHARATHYIELARVHIGQCA